MGDLAQRSGNGTTGSGGAGSSNGATASTGTPGQPVPAPSARTRTERGGSVFQVTVPDNWRTLSANSFIRYVPENAYGPMNGQNVLTHGVELGVARAASTDLLAATDTFVLGLMQGEQTVQRVGEAGWHASPAAAAWHAPLANRSPWAGSAPDGLHVQLADGNLFYVLTVVPERDEVAYAAAFESILRSIRLTIVAADGKPRRVPATRRRARDVDTIRSRTAGTSIAPSLLPGTPAMPRGWRAVFDDAGHLVGSTAVRSTTRPRSRPTWSRSCGSSDGAYVSIVREIRSWMPPWPSCAPSPGWSRRQEDFKPS